MNQVLYGAYMEHRPPVWTPLGTKGKQKFCLWGSSSPSDVFIPVCRHVHSCLLVRVQSRQGTGWSKSRKIRRGTWALVLPEMLLWYPDTFFWWLQCPQLSKHQHGQVHTHTHTHTQMGTYNSLQLCRLRGNCLSTPAPQEFLPPHPSLLILFLPPRKRQPFVAPRAQL